MRGRCPLSATPAAEARNDRALVLTGGVVNWQTSTTSV